MFNIRSRIDKREKTGLFNTVLRKCQQSNSKIITCEKNVYLSLSMPSSFGWIWKGRSLFPTAIVKDLAQANHQPMSLQHIAATSSVQILKKCTPTMLFVVYSVVKDKHFCIRAGKEEIRKSYDYTSIVKNYLFKQCYDPLVSSEYFENIEKNPVPFCIKCGLFSKIEKTAACSCSMCVFLRFALAFTPSVEKPYHTFDCIV